MLKMKFYIKDICNKKNSVVKTKSVEEMTGRDGKNIYKDIRGHENELNYSVCDLKQRLSGLENLTVSVTLLDSGKVNTEYKMTTGHSHEQEEVYHFLQGEGRLVYNGQEKYHKVESGTVITIPRNIWHQVVNVGSKQLKFLCIFEGLREGG